MNRSYKIIGSINDKCGTYMNKQDFIESVECSCLIDDDGFGRYCIGEQITNIVVYPSNLKLTKQFNYINGFDDRFSRVVWYNK